jgi:DNA-binding transcriptional LysR family regulator
MDIRTVDLNLLPVLDALLRHCSVTVAARELDMSQSAFSSALGRLRALLGDQLFVRTGRGMLPTARAAQLAGPVAAILDQVRDGVLAAGGFAPAQSHRRFALCLSDVGGYVLWPRIVRAVRAQAPQVGLQLRVLPEAGLPAALENGEADLAVGAYPGLPASLFQRRLHDRDYVCVVRTGHPLAASKRNGSTRAMTLKQFASASHVVVRLASGIQDRIDQQLAARGLRRERVLEMPSYLMLPPLLESGDELAVMPGQLADAFCRHGRLVALRPPLALPASTIRMHWHRRFHEDVANVWLRGVIAAEFGDGGSAGALQNR